MGHARLPADGRYKGFIIGYGKNYWVFVVIIQESSHRLEGVPFATKLEQVVPKAMQSKDKSDKRNELRPEQT